MRVTRAPAVGLIIGLTLFILLIAYRGVPQVVAALAGAGPGVLALAVFHAVPLLANAIGWRGLLVGGDQVRLATVARARWIGESVNGLLPVAQVGGNVVRAQLIARQGVRPARAAASVVVDITLNILAQIIFTLLGLCLLLIDLRASHLAVPVAIGAGTMGIVLGGFYFTQRRGLRGGAVALIARIEGKLEGAGLATEAAALDDALTRLYSNRRIIAATSGWHLLSWILGAGDVWLGLYFLGHPIDVVSALLIESLTQAMRTAAFVVPAGFGIQEGGFLLLGAIVGISPDVALALSLLKRARDLLLGLPGLVAWQVHLTTRLRAPSLKDLEAE